MFQQPRRTLNGLPSRTTKIKSPPLYCVCDVDGILSKPTIPTPLIPRTPLISPSPIDSHGTIVLVAGRIGALNPVMMGTIDAHGLDDLGCLADAETQDVVMSMHPIVAA